MVQSVVKTNRHFYADDSTFLAFENVLIVHQADHLAPMSRGGTCFHVQIFRGSSFASFNLISRTESSTNTHHHHTTTLCLSGHNPPKVRV